MTIEQVKQECLRAIDTWDSQILFAPRAAKALLLVIQCIEQEQDATDSRDTYLAMTFALEGICEKFSCDVKA